MSLLKSMSDKDLSRTIDYKNMEGYIYLGEHFDILGREINITDKKIGKSIEPVSREKQLNRTKSPIGYRIISTYKVDDMNKVEKMLHAILDSRRVHGEWFMDNEDTLTGDFHNFMNIYGGEYFDIKESKKLDLINKDSNNNDKLINLSNFFGKDTVLIRTYKGVDYEIILKSNGMFEFNGELFETPNKLYNNGIVKLVKGKNGLSGTNSLSQFLVKETGDRLVDSDFDKVIFKIDNVSYNLVVFNDGMVRIYDLNNKEIETNVKDVLRKINDEYNLNIDFFGKNTRQLGKEIFNLIK